MGLGQSLHQRVQNVAAPIEGAEHDDLARLVRHHEGNRYGSPPCRGTQAGTDRVAFCAAVWDGSKALAMKNDAADKRFCEFGAPRVGNVVANSCQISARVSVETDRVARQRVKPCRTTRLGLRPASARATDQL